MFLNETKKKQKSKEIKPSIRVWINDDKKGKKENTNPAKPNPAKPNQLTHAKQHYYY